MNIVLVINFQLCIRVSCGHNLWIVTELWRWLGNKLRQTIYGECEFTLKFEIWRWNWDRWSGTLYLSEDTRLCQVFPSLTPEYLICFMLYVMYITPMYTYTKIADVLCVMRLLACEPTCLGLRVWVWLCQDFSSVVLSSHVFLIRYYIVYSRCTILSWCD